MGLLEKLGIEEAKPIKKLNKGLLDDYQCRCVGGDPECIWQCDSHKHDWCGISPLIRFGCYHRRNIRARLGGGFKDLIFGKLLIQKLNKGLLDDYQCRCSEKEMTCVWKCHSHDKDWCGISPLINWGCPSRGKIR